MSLGSATDRVRRLEQLRGLGAAAAVAALSCFCGDSPLTASIPLLLSICTSEAAAARLAMSRIEPNRNLSPAGQLQDGVLNIHLEIRGGRWHPEADTGPSVAVQAFAEAGRPPQIPGPLIRVPAGTAIRATLRNALDRPAQIYGLHQRPGGSKDPLEILAGETRELRFNLTAPGTYDYWATTTGDAAAHRTDADSQLSGALIVDPAGPPAADRVFVIGLWPKRGTQGREHVAVINGKLWPSTERLTYHVGEVVHWRFISSTFVDQTMLPHCAYSDAAREVNGEVDSAPPTVTERIFIGDTGSIALRLVHQGQWLVRCQLPVDMSTADRPAEGPPSSETQHSLSSTPILGVTVLPRVNPYAAPPRPAD